MVPYRVTLDRVNLAQGSWNELYKAAVFELSTAKLLVRVDAARTAINARLEELNSTHADNPAEKARLADALRMLDMLLKVDTTSNHKSI